MASFDPHASTRGDWQFLQGLEAVSWNILGPIGGYTGPLPLFFGARAAVAVMANAPPATVTLAPSGNESKLFTTGTPNRVIL